MMNLLSGKSATGPCLYKSFGCPEQLRKEEVDHHMKDALPIHLKLVMESFSHKIEVNTNIAAYFQVKTEEVASQSLQLVQSLLARQGETDKRLEDFIRKSKQNEGFEAQKSLLLADFNARQKTHKDLIDGMVSELRHNLDQQGLSVRSLTDKIDTELASLNSLSTNQQESEKKMDKRISALAESVAQKQTDLEAKFLQFTTEDYDPIAQNLSSLEKKLERQTEEVKLISTQNTQTREGIRLMQRHCERLETEVELLQIQIKSSERSHRRSGSTNPSTSVSFDENTDGDKLHIARGMSSADIKRLEAVEGETKKMAEKQAQLDEIFQAQQSSAEEVRALAERLASVEDKLSVEISGLVRFRNEEKDRFKHEEKERLQLDEKWRATHSVMQSTIESNSSQLRQTETSLQTIRTALSEVKNQMEANKMKRQEIEDKLKQDITDLKEDLGKNLAEDQKLLASFLGLEQKMAALERGSIYSNIPSSPASSPSSSSNSLTSSSSSAGNNNTSSGNLTGSGSGNNVPVLNNPLKKSFGRERAQTGPSSSPFPVKGEEMNLKKSAAVGSALEKVQLFEKVAAEERKEKAKEKPTIASPMSKNTPELPFTSPSKAYKNEESAVLWEYDPVGGKWIKLTCSLSVDQKHFAEGALRLAFNSEVTTTVSPPKTPHEESAGYPPVDICVASDKVPKCEAKHLVTSGSKFVVKIYKKEAEKQVSRELYFEDVKMQMICRDWGSRFNQKKPPKRIEFLMAWVLELTDRNPPVLCNMEPLLVGEFKKNNSNFGAVLNNRSTPQSFSHFTYEQSLQEFIIVDIQGVDDHYTDPQIHTADGKGYGLGNLGKSGMQRFLTTHKCNAVCALIGLTPIGVGASKKNQLRGTMIMPDLSSGIPEAEFQTGSQPDNISPYSKKELKVSLSLPSQRECVSSVCIFQGNLLVTGSESAIKIYDSRYSWRCTDTLTGHKKSVDALCCTERYLYSGSADGQIKVWDPNRDFRCVQTINAHKSEISALCVNDKYLISSSHDKTIKVWDIVTYDEVKSLEAHTKSVKCMTLVGPYLFSGGNDLQIYIWDLNTLSVAFSMEGHEEWVKSLAYAGGCLLSGSHDNTLKCWSLSDFACTRTMKGHTDIVVTLLPDDRHRLLYSGSEDNSIKVWDLLSLECIHTVKKAHPGGIQSFEMYGDKLVSVSVDGSIKIWEWA